MATEQILFKADGKFVKEIDKAVKEGNYQSRTEFIRESLRKNLDDAKMKAAMEKIAHIKGSLKREKQTTDEEIEEMKARAWEKFSRKFK